jgi:hypothetical protein
VIKNNPKALEDYKMENKKLWFFCGADNEGDQRPSQSCSGK